MKLISLNVDGHANGARVYPFLEEEQADIVCLQEASEEHVQKLESIGYKTTFSPRCLKKDENGTYTDGELFASKLPHSAENFYFYKGTDELPEDSYDEALGRRPNWQVFVIASIESEDETFHIGTTHFTWTPDGDSPSVAQATDMDVFLSMTAKLPPHIMCGDFNIPRDYNRLYKNLTEVYTDNIPNIYKSSLDKTMHRFGEKPELAHIFTDYMVDYVFSQHPYIVKDVSLRFGISDHAAVIATIGKEK